MSAPSYATPRIFTNKSTSVVPVPITSNVTVTKSDSFEKSTYDKVVKLPLIFPLVFSLITAEETLGISFLRFVELKESFVGSYFNSQSALTRSIEELSL